MSIYYGINYLSNLVFGESKLSLHDNVVNMTKKLEENKKYFLDQKKKFIEFAESLKSSQDNQLSGDINSEERQDIEKTICSIQKIKQQLNDLNFTSLDDTVTLLKISNELQEIEAKLYDKKHIVEKYLGKIYERSIVGICIALATVLYYLHGMYLANPNAKILDLAIEMLQLYGNVAIFLKIINSKTTWKVAKYTGMFMFLFTLQFTLTFWYKKFD